jgi:hypothetical protein
MRSLLLVSAALLCCPDYYAADETNRVAATIIRQRANDMQNVQPVIAEQLRQLALMVQDGRTSLADAALIMQMSFSGVASGAASSLAPSITPSITPPSGPVMSAEQVTSVLDGEQVVLNKNPPEPAVKTEEKNQPLPVSTTPAADIPVVTSVVTASRVGDNKTLLVMIGAGNDQHVTIGQRFIVKRADKQLAVISATQVKAGMSICIAIAGTFDDTTEIKPGDAVVSE